MKNFLKTLLAVICGLLIVNLIGFWIIASVASIGGKAPAIPTQGVLRVDMSKIIVAEQSTQSFNFSQKDNRVTIGLLKAKATNCFSEYLIRAMPSLTSICRNPLRAKSVRRD